MSQSEICFIETDPASYMLGGKHGGPYGDQWFARFVESARHAHVMLADTRYVLAKLNWMRERRIWPNGLRYLWTDAFGVSLLVSLAESLEQPEFIDDARWVVAEVDRVLGRRRGIRIRRQQKRRQIVLRLRAAFLFDRDIPKCCVGEEREKCKSNK